MKITIKQLQKLIREVREEIELEGESAVVADVKQAILIVVELYGARALRPEQYARVIVKAAEEAASEVIEKGKDLTSSPPEDALARRRREIIEKSKDLTNDEEA